MSNSWIFFIVWLNLILMGKMFIMGKDKILPSLKRNGLFIDHRVLRYAMFSTLATLSFVFY